jgi:hypothetical protein
MKYEKSSGALFYNFAFERNVAPGKTLSFATAISPDVLHSGASVHKKTLVNCQLI